MNQLDWGRTAGRQSPPGSLIPESILNLSGTPHKEMEGILRKMVYAAAYVDGLSLGAIIGTDGVS